MVRFPVGRIRKKRSMKAGMDKLKLGITNIPLWDMLFIMVNYQWILKRLLQLDLLPL